MRKRRSTPAKRPTKPRLSEHSRAVGQRSRDVLLRSCDITETTVLVSPNATALALVQVGDILAVEFRPGPPPLVLAMTGAGTAAGAINCVSTSEIVACIQLGVEYVAKVLVLGRRSCKVRVQRRERLRDAR